MTWNTLVLIAAFIAVFLLTVVWVPIMIFEFSAWFVLCTPFGILIMAYISWCLSRVDKGQRLM